MRAYKWKHTPILLWLSLLSDLFCPTEKQNAGCRKQSYCRTLPPLGCYITNHSFPYIHEAAIVLRCLCYCYCPSLCALALALLAPLAASWPSRAQHPSTTASSFAVLPALASAFASTAHFCGTGFGRSIRPTTTCSSKGRSRWVAHSNAVHEDRKSSEISAAKPGFHRTISLHHGKVLPRCHTSLARKAIRARRGFTSLAGCSTRTAVEHCIWQATSSCASRSCA